MRKQRIRLSEAALHKIIRKCVNEAINEAGHLYWKDNKGIPHTNSKDKWHGVEGTTYISHGEWADSEVWYDGEELNGTNLEDNAWEKYCIDCEEEGKKPSEQEYDNLPSEWFQDYLDYDYIPAIKGY